MNTHLAIPVPEGEIGHCPCGTACYKTKVTKVKMQSESRRSFVQALRARAEGRWHISPDPAAPGILYGPVPFSMETPRDRKPSLSAPGLEVRTPSNKGDFSLERCNAKCTIKSVIQGEESNARTLGESSGACTCKIDSREEASSLPAKGRTMASPGTLAGEESGDHLRCSTRRPGLTPDHPRSPGSCGSAHGCRHTAS